MCIVFVSHDEKVRFMVKERSAEAIVAHCEKRFATFLLCCKKTPLKSSNINIAFYFYMTFTVCVFWGSHAC